MCTGVRFADAAGNLYFGRNLDWCESYGEGVVITCLLYTSRCV